MFIANAVYPSSGSNSNRPLKVGGIFVSILFLGFSFSLVHRKVLKWLCLCRKNPEYLGIIFKTGKFSEELFFISSYKNLLGDSR